nr:Fic family protein [Gordonia humi]
MSTGRLDTENFLADGSLEGIASRADLALLEDLRDAASFIIGNADRGVDANFVKALNATITRSGALHPGRLRTASQRIGVATQHGRHEPKALTDDELQTLIESASASDDVLEAAVDLFVAVAKAQPFEDGNKRTAIFAANALLIKGSDVILTIPVSEDDPTVASSFNEALARAYVFDDPDDVKAMLRSRGLVSRTA